MIFPAPVLRPLVARHHSSLIIGAFASFATRDENREHTEGIGEFLPMPATGLEIVATVKRMLAEGSAA